MQNLAYTSSNDNENLISRQSRNQPNQPQMGTQRSYAMVVPDQESQKDSACYEGMISGFDRK